MDRINFNNNKVNFRGVQKMENKDNTEELSMYIKVALSELKNRDREIPDYGDFSPVEESFENPDKNLPATDFAIKIVKPPKNIENHEKLRDIYLIAKKHPLPYQAQRLMAVGEKADILKKLDSEELYNDILEATESLANDLNDI